MKNMKFMPGTFLEVDDLVGGRKVALVCKDGVTFLDVLNIEKATPVVIHPSMNPVGLGTFAEYSKSKGMAVTRRVVEHLRKQSDQKIDNDSLFLIRVLWFVTKKGSGDAYTPDDSTLCWAVEQALEQENTAARNHGYAKQYCNINS